MARLFGRRCVAIVQPPNPNSYVEVLPEAVIIDGLRMKFTVKRSLEETPNQSTLTVFNLSATRRAELQKKGVKVFLQAGYNDSVKQIFSGDATLVFSKQNGPNWETEFRLGDGHRAYKFAQFSETYAPGATVEQVVRALADAMKVDPGNAVDAVLAARGPGSLDQFVYGYAHHGRASTALGEVLRSVGLTWSIQDGRLQVLRDSEPAPGDIIVISKDSGLVDSPAYTTPKDEEGPPRLLVKSLLQPSLRCGGAVEIRSRFISGQFKIHTLTHEGDTESGPWYSMLEVEAL